MRSSRLLSAKPYSTVSSEQSTRRVADDVFRIICTIMCDSYVSPHVGPQLRLYCRSTDGITYRTRAKTKSTTTLMVITLFTFGLSTAHMIMVFQYACTQYLDNDAARYGDTILQRRGDPRVYVPTILEIINVSGDICFVGRKLM